MEKKVFSCKECGYRAYKWQGHCPLCGSWNSFEEIEIISDNRIIGGKKPVNLKKIQVRNEERLTSASMEFNRVLGGGIVPGSVLLLSGEPGIGKSTLALSIVSDFAENKTVLYVSGEESLNQIKIKSNRLKLKSTNIDVLIEQDVEAIFTEIKDKNYDIVVLDSIQTLYDRLLGQYSGTVKQIKEIALKIIELAKDRDITFLIIGHVTKDGMIAGPRALEHLVDVVLYLEGSREGDFRILRTIKNRSGSTNEIGLFRMVSDGIIDLGNPSEQFINVHRESDTGFSYFTINEGSRIFIVEVQSLVVESEERFAKRYVDGIDLNRLTLMVAVMEKFLGINFAQYDIYINIAGGVNIKDPAVDLAIIAAIYSSYKNIHIKDKVLFIGEVGLSGEIRFVSKLEQRIQEGERLGFKKFIIPEKNMESENFEPVEKIDALSNIVEILDIVS